MPHTPVAVALIAAALFLTQAFAPQAVAGVAVYVDDNGNCVGFTPCWGTIQDGVANAGPPPAEVFVFPGSYTESVDLTQMGSAVGGEMGDLTLSAVGEDGVVLGDFDFFGDPPVQISGASPISALPTFDGSLYISGFGTDASIGSGIEVVATGDIEIHQATANDPPSGRDGVRAESTTGSVTLALVDANDGSGGGAGVVVAAAEDVFLSFVDAKQHGGSGAKGINATAGRDLSIEFSYANSNNGGGLTAEAGRDIVLESFSAVSNGGDGANITAGRNVALFGNRFDRNAGSGLVAEAGARIGIDELNGFDSLYTNGGNGGELTAPTIDLDSLYDVGNGGHGLVLASNDITVMRTTSGYNGGNGILIEALGGPVESIDIAATQFENNAADGLKLTGLTNSGDYMLTTNAFCGNGASGLNLQSTADVDAGKSWWGNLSGPMHPTNAGSGELITDSANGGAGDVAFTPWIDSGDISIADPQETLQARLGSTLLIRLLAGGESVFDEFFLIGAELALAEPKPKLTASNGGFSGGGDDGQTEYTAGAYPYYVPRHAGPATVTWEWGCAPDLELIGTFTAAEGPPWGDVNCDGVVDLKDVTDYLAMYNFDIQEFEGCESIFGDLAFYTFGNWDCDDLYSSDPKDVLLVLLYLAELPLPDLPGDCLAIGDTS